MPSRLDAQTLLVPSYRSIQKGEAIVLIGSPKSLSSFATHVAKLVTKTATGRTMAAFTVGTVAVAGVGTNYLNAAPPIGPVVGASQVTKVANEISGSSSNTDNRSKGVTSTSTSVSTTSGVGSVSMAPTKTQLPVATAISNVTTAVAKTAPSTTTSPVTPSVSGATATDLSFSSSVSTNTATIGTTSSVSAASMSGSLPVLQPIAGTPITVTSLVNVENYGADPSGQYDSTNAIVAAISAAEALNDHATVYFPAGRFILTQPVNRLFDFKVSSPLNLVGAGQGLTTIENEVGITTGASYPPGMFEIIGSGGPTPGGADGTVIGDMTLDTRTYQSGTAITDYANHTVVGNLDVYAPTSTNSYNPNQFGIRVIAVCSPTNYLTNYRVGNTVQNVYIDGNGGAGNTELDISCQQNTTVNGATIIGNGLDVYRSQNDSLSNLNLTSGNNGSTSFFTWVITDSQNITMTNLQTTGQPGVIEQSSRDTTSNVVINNEVSNTLGAKLRIGDALSTTIENSKLGGIYLDPSQVLSGMTVANSSLGKVACSNVSYISGLSGISCP